MSGGSSLSTRIELLKHVPEALRRDIAQRLRPLRASKGRSLVEKDSPTTDVFFLLEGTAEVVLYSSDGREVRINNIRPGAMFGEIAALDGKLRSASIVASSDVLVVAMRGSDFTACLDSSPAAGRWLAGRLAAHARRLTEHVFELSALTVQARVHCELLRLAREGAPCRDGIEVRDVPTHHQLAIRIGTHREAVTRAMSMLSKDKIIRHGRGKLMILDLARLEQMPHG